MDDEQVRKAIEELERELAEEAIGDIDRGLARDDPAFVKRVRALRRADVVTIVAVCLLLAGGSVLLTVGLATLSWLVAGAGVVAFLCCFALDEHHKHTLRRMT